MAVVEAAGDRASARRIASYLLEVRPILAGAMRGWDSWVRKIGVLTEEVRHGSPGLVAHGAGKVGREQVAVFRDARRELERLEPPPCCLGCQRALLHWLEALIDACEVLIAVGASGDLRRIRETQEHLASGRVHARRFNAEYARLAADLRQRVAAATATRPRRPRGVTAVA